MSTFVLYLSLWAAPTPPANHNPVCRMDAECGQPYKGPTCDDCGTPPVRRDPRHPKDGKR